MDFVAGDNIDDVKRMTSGKFTIVGMVQPLRPFVLLFGMILEHRYYDPRNRALNDQLQYFIVNWKHMRCAVIAIPLEDRPKAEECARESYLRLADGVPTLITEKGPEFFPIQGPTVFTLENDWDHIPWKPHQIAEMLEVDRQRRYEVKRIWDAGGRP